MEQVYRFSNIQPQIINAEKRKTLRTRDSSEKSPELPESFTNIWPAAFISKNPSPLKVDRLVTIDMRKFQLTEDFEWMEKVYTLKTCY